MYKKAKPKNKRPDKYDEKLAVSGSFLDIMKATGKEATNKASRRNGLKNLQTGYPQLLIVSFV
jgi:hypothetical protein